MVTRKDGAPPGESTRLIQVRLTPKEWETYTALAFVLDLNKGELVREALKDRLAKFQKTGKKLPRR